MVKNISDTFTEKLHTDNKLTAKCTDTIRAGKYIEHERRLLYRASAELFEKETSYRIKLSPLSVNDWTFRSCYERLVVERRRHCSMYEIVK